MKPKEIFNKFGALHIKDVVPKDVCSFITQAMMRSPAYTGKHDDEQIPNSFAITDHEYMIETIQERIWHSLENVLEEELIPTYSYGRVYQNKNELKKHTDRPACEVSITIQLARTHHYAWPIYMGGQRFDLAEGDGVLYKGCDIEHWRNPCEGPENYLSGQIFCHYVRKNGAFTEWAGDKRWSKDLPFDRFRQFSLENK
jgi:hypothetical protein